MSKTIILNELPRSKDDAMTASVMSDNILNKLGKNIGVGTIRTTIKQLRREGHPILWNRKGLYLTHSRFEIEKHIGMIDKMVVGYSFGMNDISNNLQSTLSNF